MFLEVENLSSLRVNTHETRSNELNWSSRSLNLHVSDQSHNVLWVLFIALLLKTDNKHRSVERRHGMISDRLLLVSLQPPEVPQSGPFGTCRAGKQHQRLKCME